VLYYLSKGDPGKLKQLRQTKEKDILNYYYLNRVNDLNELREHLAYMKKMEERWKLEDG
jgi:hypothetical protein